MTRRILIVEDSKTEKILLAGLLGKEYKVVEASDGEECLSIVQHSYKSLSAILLDLMMPKMDGFEVLKKIKFNILWRNIPVIVTTGRTDEESQIRALDLGANAYVMKPVHGGVLLRIVHNTINLCETSALANATFKDKLTGLYNREAFSIEAAKLVRRKEAGYYVLSHLNIEHFKVINDQHGHETGDCVLKHIASILKEGASETGGIAAHLNADKFAILYPAGIRNSEYIKSLQKRITQIDFISQPITVRVGRYIVVNKDLTVSAMYDRALMAESSIFGKYDLYVAEYDEAMRKQLLYEQEIVTSMDEALKNGQFVPYFQPQFNHATGALTGAEALVRWNDPKNGLMIPTIRYIHVFERNGFIYKLDKYIWEQVCICLRKWLDAGIEVVPVSVNISRVDIFQDDMIQVITGLVEKYAIPIALLRLEITESAFSEASDKIVTAVKQLLRLGFTVEIDDFGSGYSSLNTLKDVPAQILKLDMKFLENTEDSQRSGNIIESVVRMAKWIGMAVIAEGVETVAQADYLQSIGCSYIQGYLYAKPMPLTEYETILAEKEKRPNLSRLKTVEKLDNNAFWNPESMDTLIFNSYVGGACIFEYHDGDTELLRVNDRYVQVLGCFAPADKEIRHMEMPRYLYGRNYDVLHEMIAAAISSQQEESCEVTLTDAGAPEKIEFIRLAVRVIATTGDRYLFYCRADNLTKQRLAERQAAESTLRLNTIMENISGGVSAILIDDEGHSKLVSTNEKYYEMFGYTKKQAEEENLDVMTRILPEDFPNVLEKVKKLKADKKPTVIDYRVKRRDGTLCYHRVNAYAIHMDGYEDEVITSIVTDITEQKTLADQLAAIVNNIYGGVSATVIRGGKPIFIVVNDQFCHMLGYETYEEYKNECGDDKYSRIHPEDRERIVKQFETSDGGKDRYTMKYRVIRRDGSIGYMLNNIRVIHMFGVEEPVQLSVVNDVTELNIAKQKEHNTAAQLRAIIGSINGGVSAGVLTQDNKIELVFANKGFYRLFGYTKEQFSSELKGACELVHPEDYQRTKEIVAKMVRERGSAAYEYRCIKRDGSSIWVQCRNSVIALEGVGQNVLIGVNTDITEAKEAERELRQTYDKLDTVMAHVDSGLMAYTSGDTGAEIILANDRLYEVLGYSRSAYEKIVAEDLFLPVHPEDRARVRAAVFQANQNTSSTTLEFRIVRQDESIVWIKLVVNTIRLSGVDKPVQVGLFTDITLEVEAAEQLRFLNDSAREILAQPDCDLAIRETIEGLLRYFAGERAGIFEYDDADKSFRNTYAFCAGGFAEKERQTREMPSGIKAAWREKIARKEFVVIPSVEELDEGEGKLRAFLLAQGIRSLIVAPLWREQKLIGYMGMENPARAIGQVHQLRALADYVAVLITRRDLNRKIEGDEKAMLTLLDNLPCGAAMCEFDGEQMRTIHVNERYVKMVSRSLEGIDEQSFRAVFPDDLTAVMEEIRQAIADGRDALCDVRLLCGDGEYHPFHVNARIKPQGDGRHIMFNTYTPLPEHELAFKQAVPFILSTIMEESTDLSFVKDRNFRYLCCSNTLASLIGQKSAAEVVGKTDYDLFPKEIADKFRRDDAAIIATGKPLIDTLVSIPAADGTVHYTRTSKHLLRNTVGEIIGLYGCGRDETAIKLLADKAAKQERALSAIMAATPGGIFKYSAESDEFSFVSDTMYEMLGYTPEEFREKFHNRFSEMVWHDDRKQAIDKINADIAKTGTNDSCDIASRPEAES